jgi:hypothetical protein
LPSFTSVAPDRRTWAQQRQKLDNDNDEHDSGSDAHPIVLVLVIDPLPQPARKPDLAKPPTATTVPFGGKLAFSLEAGCRSVVSPIVLVLVLLPVNWCESLPVVAFVHVGCPPDRRASAQQRQKIENENDDEKRLGLRCGQSSSEQKMPISKATRQILPERGRETFRIREKAGQLRRSSAYQNTA